MEGVASKGSWEPRTDPRYYTRREKYYDPEEVWCEVRGCETPRTPRFTLRAKHRRNQSQYKVPLDRYVVFWDDPECENPTCERTDSIHVDHDHKTGEFRGFLCVGCNIALGHLQESRVKAEGLIKYMEAMNR